MFDIKWIINVSIAIIITVSELMVVYNDAKINAPAIKSSWSNIGAGLPLFMPNLLLIKLPAASPNNAPKLKRKPTINPYTGPKSRLLL